MKNFFYYFFKIFHYVHTLFCVPSGLQVGVLPILLCYMGVKLLTSGWGATCTYYSAIHSAIHSAIQFIWVLFVFAMHNLLVICVIFYTL